MKKVSFNFAIGLFVLVVTVSSTWAQRGGRLHYSSLFNPQTVGAVSSEVVRVDYPLAGTGPLKNPRHKGVGRGGRPL